MQGQDAYGVALLTDQGITSYPQCDESQLAFLSLLEVPEILKTQLCLDTQLNTQNHIKLEMENADAYFPCIVNIDMEKGKFETEKTNDETFENLKNEDPLTVSLFVHYTIHNLDLIVQLLHTIWVEPTAGLLTFALLSIYFSHGLVLLSIVTFSYIYIQSRSKDDGPLFKKRRTVPFEAYVDEFFHEIW